MVQKWDCFTGSKRCKKVRKNMLLTIFCYACSVFYSFFWQIIQSCAFRYVRHFLKKSYGKLKYGNLFMLHVTFWPIRLAKRFGIFRKGAQTVFNKVRLKRQNRKKCMFRIFKRHHRYVFFIVQTWYYAGCYLKWMEYACEK